MGKDCIVYLKNWVRIGSTSHFYHQCYITDIFSKHYSTVQAVFEGVIIENLFFSSFLIEIIEYINTYLS